MRNEFGQLAKVPSLNRWLLNNAEPNPYFVCFAVILFVMSTVEFDRTPHLFNLLARII